MDEALKKFHIRSCVRDALSRNGIPHDSPLRAHLEANATIAAGDASHVVMKNGNSLDAEIENWLASQRLAGGSPPGPRTISKSDTEGIQNHFADTAAGRVRVS